MILDTVGRLGRYQSIHRLLPAAVEFIRRPDLEKLTDGRHAIAGDELGAIVIRDFGKPAEAARLETHRRFIDIQVVLRGTDTMGWKPSSACLTADCDYDPEKDLQFFVDPPDAWVPVQPGQFAIFFPEDAHAPMVSRDFLHKVVIKAAV